MKYLTTLTLALLPLTFFSRPFTPVQFLEGKLAEVQLMAAEQDKFYLIHFVSNGCMPSQWMEKHTFRNEPLAAFLEENYLALRADVEQAEGQALKEQYAVRILPTILVFSAQGKLLGRHEGAMEPEALLVQLKVYGLPAIPIRAHRAAIESNILASPQPVFSISRPALIPDVFDGQPLQSEVAYSPTPVAGYSPAGDKLHRPQRSYFTVQVGVFSSYDNAVRQCSTLEEKVSYKVEMAPCQLNGQGLFKIFLGHFEKQDQAIACLRDLRKRSIDGFVKLIDN